MNTQAPLDLRLDALRRRMERLLASARRIYHDINPENDAQRLRPCECGRQWTRQDVCSMCAHERGAS